jgi:phospholipid transport system transporter-binding protein
MDQPSTIVGETLMLAGPLNLASMPRLLQETEDYTNQATLPDALSIDFSEVTDVDSSSVALMLHWRRKALKLNKPLRYVHLPHNLVALAELYGVDQLIHCPSQQQSKNQPGSSAAPSTSG